MTERSGDSTTPPHGSELAHWRSDLRGFEALACGHGLEWVEAPLRGAPARQVWLRTGSEPLSLDAAHAAVTRAASERAVLAVAVARTPVEEEVLQEAGFERVAQLLRFTGSPLPGQGVSLGAVPLDDLAAGLRDRARGDALIAAPRGAAWLDWRYGRCPVPHGSRAVMAGRTPVAAAVLSEPVQGTWAVQELWLDPSAPDAGRELLDGLCAEAGQRSLVLEFLVPLGRPEAGLLLELGLSLESLGSTLFALPRPRSIDLGSMRERWWWSRGELLLPGT